jgi:hypothetical protein
MLRLELQGWKGTKFCRGIGARAKRGVASDCVSFVEGVLVNLGAITSIEWPRYVVYGGGPEMFDLLVRTIEAVPNIKPIWKTGPLPHLLPGDIFVRSIGGDYHHLALFAGKKALWHMREGRGLRIANLHDPRVTEDLKGIYRVYEPAN